MLKSMQTVCVTAAVALGGYRPPDPPCKTINKPKPRCLNDGKCVTAAGWQLIIKQSKMILILQRAICTISILFAQNMTCSPSQPASCDGHVLIAVLIVN